MRPTAGKAALRPAQSLSRSTSSAAVRKEVAPLSSKILCTRQISSDTSSFTPSNSHNKIASASSGYPACTNASAAWIASLSIISKPAGIIPAAIMSPTAAPAFPISSNAAITSWARCGLASNFTVTSVMTASMPSLPVSKASRSKPAQSKASEPISNTSPSIVMTRSFMTLFTVSPYFRQCTPPEFSATLPPMVQAIWLEGSGA